MEERLLSGPVADRRAFTGRDAELKSLNAFQELSKVKEIEQKV